MTNLTPKQQRIYDFIRTFTRRQGYPPTAWPISRRVGGYPCRRVKVRMKS